MMKRKADQPNGPGVSQSFLSYDLLRRALIELGYLELETDEIY